MYNPEIGDGRGFLRPDAGGRRRVLDLAQKGLADAFSRTDGRLTLKGRREILATEMLEALCQHVETFSD